MKNAHLYAVCFVERVQLFLMNVMVAFLTLCVSVAEIVLTMYFLTVQ